MINKSQPKPFDAWAILVGGIAGLVIGAVVLDLILVVVGETVEHFVP